MTRLSTLAVLFAALLALAACGSNASSDSAAADDAATDSTTDATVNDDATDGDANDVTSVKSLDDLPKECRDAIADFLVAIEPVVSDVDWETATVADMQTMGTSLDAPGAELDTKLSDAGCENFQPDSDSDTMAMMIDLAKDKAPGTVEWLTFIGTFASEDALGASSDLPTDCDGAVAYAEGLTADAATMMDLPVTEMVNIGSVMETIQTECSPDEAAAFFDANEAFFAGQ